MDTGKESRRGFLGKIAILLSLPMFGSRLSLGEAARATAPPSSWLDQIVTNPDDDGLRLRYADWLTEQGNPLGEYVRSEVLRSQVDHTHADYYRWQSLADRVYFEGSEETPTRGDQWTGAAESFTFCATTERGLVEQIEVDDLDRFLRCERELLKAAPLLRKLKLSNIKSEEQFQSFLKCKAAARIRTLGLIDCSLGPRSLELLASCNSFPQLRKLFLISSDLRADGLDRFSARGMDSRLEALTIRNCTFSDSIVDQVSVSDFSNSPYRSFFRASGFEALTELSISDSTFGRQHAESLVQSPVFKQLTALALGGCPTGGDWLKAATMLGNPLPLKVLSAAGTKLGEAESLTLAAFPRLEVLLIRGAKCSGKSLDDLFRTLPGCLKKLSLGENVLGNAGLEKLANCSTLRGLRLLDLVSCGIGGSGLQELSASPYLQKLVMLKLGWNNLSPKAASEFVTSRNARSLSFLHLGDCGIGEKGAIAIANSSQLRDLTWLNVDDNGIGDLGIRSILESRNLKGLMALRADYCEDREDELGRIWRERFGAYFSLNNYAVLGKLI